MIHLWQDKAGLDSSCSSAERYFFTALNEMFGLPQEKMDENMPAEILLKLKKTDTEGISEHRPNLRGRLQEPVFFILVQVHINPGCNLTFKSIGGGSRGEKKCMWATAAWPRPTWQIGYFTTPQGNSCPVAKPTTYPCFILRALTVSKTKQCANHGLACSPVSQRHSALHWHQHDLNAQWVFPLTLTHPHILSVK